MATEQAYDQQLTDDYSTVLKAALKLTKDPGLAEELTQEVMARVWKKNKLYTEQGQRNGWLFTVTRNLFITLHRRNGSRPVTRTLTQLDAENIAADISEPDTDLVQQEKTRTVRQLLMRLKPHHRQILELCDMQEEPYHVAAARLDIRFGSVGSRLSSARKAMRELVDNLPPESI